MLIRTRLTLQFLLIGGLIMITASSEIYFFTSEFRRDEFRNLLRGRAISTAKLVLDSYEFNANLLLRTRSDYPSRLTDEKIIILNNENDTLYISDRSWHFAKTGAVINRVKTGKELYAREGDSEILGTSHTNGIYKFIVIAAATDKDGRLFMKKLLTILILVCIVSLFLFSIAGWFYSGRALKPISDMVRKVGDISIASLNLRVPEGNEIDELGQLAKTFNSMLGRLETAFSTQKDFIANASHELRTPLTSINGQIEVLMMKDRSVPEYKSALASVLEDIRSLIDLSNKLLLIARAGAEEPAKQHKHVRIDEILWQARDEIKKFNEDFHISIILRDAIADSDQITVFGDEYLLKVAFSNLMDNACKYSHDHTVNIKFGFSEDFVEVTFKDQGIGIPREDISKIFDPFFRGSNTSFVRGSGIGLSLVKRIIQNHNGTIDISSEPGKGTVIRIRFRSVAS